ncbi:hypothetical protein MicloDRAFT_00051720 [Microvirga lotononidis]|uniref:Uncharacterized protein n=1 Tax=Microvirga lotononidis TaxID=864069 RepID=I4YKG8_9HYPH|nr:hypothetical protein MicloDRAFT_00051720 [Microvirga lotononidis]
MDDWFFSALKLTTRAIEVGGIAIIADTDAIRPCVPT